MLTNLLFLNKCCIFILFLYFLLNLFLRNVEEYKKHDYNKRCYILKNIIKSFMLFLMSFFSINKILLPALENNWNNYDAHIFSSIYVWHTNFVATVRIFSKAFRNLKNYIRRTTPFWHHFDAATL